MGFATTATCSRRGAVLSASAAAGGPRVKPARGPGQTRGTRFPAAGRAVAVAREGWETGPLPGCEGNAGCWAAGRSVPATGEGESHRAPVNTGRAGAAAASGIPARSVLLGRTVCEHGARGWCVSCLLMAAGPLLPPLAETNQTVPGLPCSIFLPEDRPRSEERGHQFCTAREKINL